MSFVGKFFVLVVVTGAVELYVLVAAADHLGLFGTAALCVVTGVLGGAIVRHQGLQTLQQIQRELARGVAPAVDIASGVVLLLVGAMLITPGFITDTLGFTLLVPAVRQGVAGWLVRLMRARVRFVGAIPGFDEAPRRPSPTRGRVIDVDVDP